MRDLYQEVTDKIIAELERGAAPWLKPWTSAAPAPGAAMLPRNYASGRTYRGINIPLLWSAPFPDQRWLTFKQAQELGAHVRKGERGSMIVFFKPWAVRDVNASGDAEEKTIPVLRMFHVFNVAQIDGLPDSGEAAAPAPGSDPIGDDRHQRAAALLAQARVTHGGDRAFYAPDADLIALPPPASFSGPDQYSATALHELTHWTGHKSRLDRLSKLARFGDEEYAREELCAELGAAFLCAEFGIINPELRHAGYIDSWLRVLRRDKRAVIQAASLAQKAADFITGRSAAAEPEQEARAAA